MVSVREGSSAGYVAVTNGAFFLRETTVAARLLVDGVSPAEVRRRVMEGDLFELRSASTRHTHARTVLGRLAGADRELLELLADGSPDTRRLANLLLIVREHRLLRELIAEVLVDKLARLDRTLRPVDLRAFFDEKRDSSREIAGWSDATWAKARRNILQILTDGGLLELAARGEYVIRPSLVPPALAAYLELRGRGAEVGLLLGGRSGG